MPDVEPLAPLMAAPVATTLAEVHAGDRAPAVGAEPPPIVASPAAAPHEPDAAASGAIPKVMHEADRLRGIGLVYWLDHVERTMATGRAIMASGSPQTVARLQMSYLQSSLSSGIAHAGAWARLSTEIARDMFRGR